MKITIAILILLFSQITFAKDCESSAKESIDICAHPEKYLTADDRSKMADMAEAEAVLANPKYQTEDMLKVRLNVQAQWAERRADVASAAAHRCTDSVGKCERVCGEGQCQTKNGKSPAKDIGHLNGKALVAQAEAMQARKTAQTSE